MLKISPHRYKSAQEALQSIGDTVESLGERALVVANKTALERFEDVIRSSLKESMIGVSFEISLGPCCRPEVERLVEEAKKEDVDMIIGAGAGKTLDVAKLVADTVGARMISVPTVASSYAAYTHVVYLYNEDGQFLEIKDLDSCPDLLLLDYKVTGLAPSRHLKAGIGTAMATSYQIDVTREDLELHQPTHIAFELANHLRETLFEKGEKALTDVKRGEVTGLVESVIEASILEAGLVSSLGGVPFRSIIANYLAAYLSSYTDEEILFGEIVAFGVLVQELMKGAKVESMHDLIEFFAEIEIPLTLDSLGLPENQRDSVLHDATESIENQLQGWDLAFDVTESSLLESTYQLDEIGQQVVQSGVDSIS